MTSRRTIFHSEAPFVLTTIFFAMFFTASSFAANFPLEIIQPQPSLSTANRYYKAYPGLEYNVKVGVFGGTFPFVYTLTTYPAGMTINADTGVITWANPTTSGSPHNITVNVRDVENTTVTRSWTVTVTTSGFYFIDAVNGNDSNTGTISSPLKTIGGMYKGSKGDRTYSGGFLYFRTGTYYTNAPGTVLEDSNSRLPLTGNNKPIVWMGYPGEVATIDTYNANVIVYSGTANTYFDNLRIINMRAISGCETNHGIAVDSGQNNYVFRRLTFYNQGQGSGGCNDSSIMIKNGGTPTNYMLLTENTFDTGIDAYALLGYYVNKAVIEYNTISNWSGGNSHLIGPKANNRYWAIRKNTAVNNITNVDGIIWIDTYATSNNFDISFNNVKTNGGNALVVGNEPTTYTPVYSYRNTYQGGISVQNYNSGVFSFTQDIIINSDTPKITTTGGGTPTQTTLLTGSAANSIVDSTGVLQGTYRTNYLGVRGWEMTPAPSPTLTPSPPTGILIN